MDFITHCKTGTVLLDFYTFATVQSKKTKQNMKNRILQILGVAIVATIGMVSCTTDACKDVECGDNGTCLEGVCICDAGYTGVNCDATWAEAFAGVYSGVDTCGFTYESTITVSTNFNEINVSNAFGLAATAEATVSTETGISFASQDVNGWTILGSGTLNGNVLTVDYTIDGDACQVVYTK